MPARAFDNYIVAIYLIIIALYSARTDNSTPRLALYENTPLITSFMVISDVVFFTL